MRCELCGRKILFDDMTLDNVKPLSMGGVSTKTIEDIFQLLQCQPQNLIEWKVDLKPELAYERRYRL